ncbi:S8 family peptidase [Streptomyces sp. NRRL S-340]|uniref:S8 family peptidase n=1 Tax=Streptomyces sp. NRRL S-340 TaxID=1463901 RepID=UPI000B298EF3|nr:S8 family serine peptidase [Streptomyces sp. NRRL S-340]
MSAVALATVLISSGTAGGAAAAPPGGARHVTGAAASGAPKTVTLITGDQVKVTAAGQVTAVERAAGRGRVPFSLRTVAGHTHVVPDDAQLLLAAGRLDPRLFDVTELLADGYDDAHRSGVPLIVTFRDRKARSVNAFTDAGARIDRALPVIGGAALHTDKKRGADFWNAVTGGGASARPTAGFTGSTAVAKVWLDGKRHGTLDRSVPQIGAPAAWAAGYDGTGVKVAVLDSGVDKTHPDLAGKVIGEQNFTDSPDTADHYGHGTHAASVVAGTGAESGGRYKGVAPGAEILNGKVLDDRNTGEESGVIAGMEWAVAQGADIVNLSLGGEDTPGVDPVEETVNRLSAESRTLFVVAAGNEGKDEHTVESPGSAEAALTVGAVDKADKLADFSGRGPRVGDSGVKPDLTAPGVAITAASASGSTLEGQYPSDIPGYLTLDGTSMATPHVAGAAALLAQQHHDWDGARLKAVLTGSAEPGPYSSFQQGTGRTDVARAIGQSVVAEQGPLDFGRQEWPHTDDEPVTKQLTYRNLGTGPVTLDLSVEALSVDGKPAAEGLFAVSPQHLTVPAGGTATASVTADTRAGDTDGTFGGSVTAASADGKVRVRTALGVEREVEMYDLTLRHLDENGTPIGDATTEIQGIDTDFHAVYADEEDGELTVRLPRGDYSLSGIVHANPSAPTRALLFQPLLRLDKDTTVTVDARQARPVRATLPDPAAENIDGVITVGWQRRAGLDPGLFTYGLPGFQNFTVGQLGPRLPAGQAFAQYSGTWSDQSGGTPVAYHLAWRRTGRLGGFSTEVRPEQLAKVDFRIGSPTEGKEADLFAQTWTPRGELSALGTPLHVSLPLSGTQYVLGHDVEWSFLVLAGDGPDAQLWGTGTYRSGKSYTERYNVGVFGPALSGAGGTPSPLVPGIARNGNVVRAYLPQFNDGAGHWNTTPGATADSSLRADGVEISDPHGVSPTDDVVQYAVPAQDSAYKLTVDTSRDAARTPVSTRVRTEWTFRSARTPEGTWAALPLSVVRFTPELTLNGTAKAGQRFDVPFHIEGAAAGRPPHKLSFEVSYDEGRTWQHADAVAGTHLSLRHPDRAGSVSLRAALTDAQGNTLDQTIERAYLTTE